MKLQGTPVQIDKLKQGQRIIWNWAGGVEGRVDEVTKDGKVKISVADKQTRFQTQRAIVYPSSLVYKPGTEPQEEPAPTKATTPRKRKPTRRPVPAPLEVTTA